MSTANGVTKNPAELHAESVRRVKVKKLNPINGKNGCLLKW